ncbi:carboxymuconolactone decarboxylase family protein [Aromatoleum toluclasticum]|uniref:carboxymuconolactone decarboxylase family protein n=1 Tax=Aromatoleum toluclasticum TaxID=92003 RepID=UPI001D18446D|nr:carboxymuconolactone decarboxylase family protein [Aromatoleum toluclasticum]MCC4118154.1 carboxymuconolactone decarboxylase family protein [Aromatoleum toluclasticum]
MLAGYQISLPPQTLESAEGQTREVLDKALKQVGFIPNMYANMVHSPGVLNTYLEGYAAFRKESGFTPTEQEVVFLVISRENGCEYCVSAHSFIADKASGVPAEVTDAIRDGRPIADPKLKALAEFTRVLVASRGLPDRTQTDAFLSAGYSERQILEIVLAIAVKTLSNYSNHLFHTSLDDMFASRRWVDTR